MLTRGLTAGSVDASPWLRRLLARSDALKSRHMVPQADQEGDHRLQRAISLVRSLCSPDSCAAPAAGDASADDVHRHVWQREARASRGATRSQALKQPPLWHRTRLFPAGEHGRPQLGCGCADGHCCSTPSTKPTSSRSSRQSSVLLMTSTRGACVREYIALTSADTQTPQPTTWAWCSCRARRVRRSFYRCPDQHHLSCARGQPEAAPDRLWVPRGLGPRAHDPRHVRGACATNGWR